MADIKAKYGSITTVTVTGLDSLAGGSYTTVANCSEVDNTSNLFVDVLVEVYIASITAAGNKQVIVYAVNSLDDTNYSDGQSGNPQIMRVLGVVPMNGSGPWRSAAMSLSAAFAGAIPPKWKVVLHNDNSSTALTTGNTVKYRGMHYQSV